MTSATAIIITAVQHADSVHVNIFLGPTILEIVTGRKSPPFVFQKTADSEVPPSPRGGRRPLHAPLAYDKTRHRPSKSPFFAS